MADKNKISEMLESLLNNEQDKAEELFHEYVVEKSREIYENLIDSEIDEASKKEEDDEEDDEELDEASKKEEEDDEEMDESFVDIDEESEEDDEESEEDEGEEEEGGEEGDATDDFMGDVEDGEEEGDDEDPATKGDVMDLKSEIEQLQAAFDAFMGDEANEPEHADMGDMGDEMGMGDSLDAGVDQIQDLSTVREYTEKIGGATYDKFAKGGDNGANTKSVVAGKNDMGGTTANIAKGGEAGEGGTKGGLLNPGTKDLGVNGPKEAAKGAFKGKVPGHGAEKKGAGETGTNTASLFRGK